MAQPRADYIALAISALAAAVSIACAVRDTRSEPVALAAPVASAEPEPAPNALDTR